MVEILRRNMSYREEAEKKRLQEIENERLRREEMEREEERRRKEMAEKQHVRILLFFRTS